MSDDQVRTVDKDIKTGLWQNNLDGRFIKVRSVGLTVIRYNDEGCKGVYNMGVSELLDNYRLYEADKPAPVVDNTFNDDTLAQTFGDIGSRLAAIKFNPSGKHRGVAPVMWDKGTNEKCEAITAALCPDCGRTVPADSLGALFMTSSSGVCNYCSAKHSREKINASKMRLIGIHGPARAGKDTLASYLLDNLSDDWSRSSFADPIKKMLEVIGVDCSDDAKAVIDDCFGVTPRHMMQTLGTEWGRHMIDGDIWVKAFARLNAGKCVIVPDVRFENEAELVRANGVLIHLVGRGGIDGNHVSENAIAFKPGDIVIDNSRDLAWLHGQVDGNAVLGEFIAEVGE